jgi:hypothetical protein
LSYGQIDCETAVKNLNSILCDTALKSTKFVKKRMGKRSSKQNKKPWFSDSCHDLYITVKKYCSLVNKFPENDCYRKFFYSFRSKFRRKCKHGEKIYKNQIFNKMSQNMKSDPKTFWNLLNKLSSERIQDECFIQTELIKFLKFPLKIFQIMNFMNFMIILFKG